MRVLALTHVFPRARDDPSAPFLLTWAQGLVAAGASVSVVAPHDAGLPSRHDVAGVPVRRVRYAPARGEVLAYRGEMHRLARTPTGAVRASVLVASLAAALRTEAARVRPDVVHVHWWLPGAIAARLSAVRQPVVVTVHGTDVALCESRPRLATVARWALGRADRVEAVSADLAERLARVVGRDVDGVNPMPLEQEWLEADVAESATNVAAATSEGPLVVLGVGRLVAEKGFADLLDAVARLDRPARVRLVGEGPERLRLLARARALGVELDLVGRVPHTQLRGAYAGADVVVQPSHREGFGLVAAEAAVLGVPVVATDCGGARDVLPADQLIAVGDVAALAAALTAVADDPAGARRRAAAAGARLRDRLSPEAAARRTLAAYRATVADQI